MKWLQILWLGIIFANAGFAQISPNALDFNGSNNKVSFQPLPFFTTLGTNSFTVEAWVRYDDSTNFTQGTIFNTRDETGFTSQGFRICILNGYLTVFAGGGGYSVGSNTLFSDGLCHHIAVVRASSSSSTIAVYIDGIYHSISNFGDVSSQILPSIGATNGTNFELIPFKGVIKEVRVWSAGRTQSEIQSNANVVVPNNSLGLVYYWRMNEGSGPIVNNYCINTSGGNGLLSGIANWTTACNGPCSPPAAVISYNTPLTFCYGGSVVLNAPSGTGYMYQWMKDNVNINGSTGQSKTIYLPGNYSVAITNLCGTSISNPVIVTVIYPPSSGLSPPGPLTRCNSAYLWANAGAGFAYQWKKNGVNISGANNYFYTATTSGNYSFSAITSCTTVNSISVAVTIITAVPSIPGTISVSGGNAKVCPGDTRTYSIIPIGNATSYTWTAPQGSVIQSGQGTTSIVILYNSGFTATDTLRVKANNICGSSNIRKLTIVRNNPAKPSVITGPNFGLCNASAIPYSVTNVSGINYAWSFSVPNTQVVSGQGSNTITASYSSGFLNGVLNVNASNACGVSLARSLTVYAKPATPPSITGPSLVCVNQQNVAYSIAPVAGAASYTWTSPSGAIVSNGTISGNIITSSATSVQVDFALTAGNIRARANNSCASGGYRSLAVAFNCREVVGDIEEERINVYPNPFDDEFSFTGNGFKEVQIFNEQGQLVFHSFINESNETLKPNLPDGVYMISFISEHEIKNLRLVRIRVR